MKIKLLSPIGICWLLIISAAAPVWSQTANQVRMFDKINQDAGGTFSDYGVGTHLLDKDHGWFNNSHYASSIKIPDGFEVWACDGSEGPTANGSNICSSYFEGNYNLSAALNNKVSYLSVQYNQHVKTGKACLFAGFDNKGLSLCFGMPNTYQLAARKFEHPANFDLPNVGDWRKKASSIWVANGYTLDVCTNQRVIVINGKPVTNNCATFAAGEHNLNAALNNQSYYVRLKRPIKIKKVDLPPRKPLKKGKNR